MTFNSVQYALFLAFAAFELALAPAAVAFGFAVGIGVGARLDGDAQRHTRQVEAFTQAVDQIAPIVFGHLVGAG